MHPLVPPPFTGIEAIQCLLTEATSVRNVVERNIEAGGYDEAAPVLFDRLVSAGWIVPTVGDRTRFRLSTDIIVLDCSKPAPAAAQANNGPRFSIFRGGITAVRPAGETTPAALYAELTSGRLRPQTERLRAAGREAPDFARLKNALDYVTPGGCFSRRGEAGLVKASGMIVLDFDKLNDVAAARAALLSDAVLGPAVVLLFISPSGDGLKCFLAIDPHYSHRENFNTLRQYLARKYAALGLVPDESGKDVSRACFLAHDPDAYLNPIYHHQSKLAA